MRQKSSSAVFRVMHLVADIISLYTVYFLNKYLSAQSVPGFCQVQGSKESEAQSLAPVSRRVITQLSGETRGGRGQVSERSQEGFTEEAALVLSVCHKVAAWEGLFPAKQMHRVEGREWGGQCRCVCVCTCVQMGSRGGREEEWPKMSLERKVGTRLFRALYTMLRNLELFLQVQIQREVLGRK